MMLHGFLVRFILNKLLFLFKHDNHVEIFTFQGRRLQNNRMDSLYQFTWRPRPPRYVTQEQKDEIKKNFKKYQNKFETQDKMSQSKTSKVSETLYLLQQLEKKLQRPFPKTKNDIR